MSNSKPSIEVEVDFDGYFEALVNQWINEKAREDEEFKHKTIWVSAGPWRSSALSYRSKEDVLYLDFYSALRSGFGSLSQRDIERIKAVL